MRLPGLLVRIGLRLGSLGCGARLGNWLILWLSVADPSCKWAIVRRLLIPIRSRLSYWTNMIGSRGSWGIRSQKTTAGAVRLLSYKNMGNFPIDKRAKVCIIVSIMNATCNEVKTPAANVLPGDFPLAVRPLPKVTRALPVFCDAKGFVNNGKQCPLCGRWHFSP